MARSRTTKQIAKRITLDYFKTPNSIRMINRIGIGVLSVGALIFGAAAMTRSNQEVFNPGPVSRAHASIQHDCRQCHDGGSNDPNAAGFNLAVSDMACLKCHDGPVHHSNQSTLISTAMASGHVTSANCVECHVEHRGHEALAAVSSQHCTVCHEDLEANSKDKGAIRIDKSITQFVAANHPEFGRTLLAPGTAPNEASGWNDPTPLAFNHAKHMDLFKNMESIQNCYGCHSSAGLNPNARLPGPADTEMTSASPPWLTPADRNPLWMRDKNQLTWATSADHDYIGPVNYERACVECHRLDHVPGMALPHESMETVRQALSTYALTLEQAEKQFPKQLEEELKKNPKLLDRTRPGPPPLRRPVNYKLTPEQWIEEQMKPILGNMGKWFEDDAPTKPGWPEKFKGVAAGQLLRNPEALQFYAAYAGANSCAKCHTITSESASSTAPADPAAPVRLMTAPTGIGDTPRRWFVNSQFDHDAHRNQSCLDCHHGAKESKLTTDVLMPKMEDCTSCHHPSSNESLGAGSACVTCHVYHDRSLERRLLLPAQPMAAAPAPAAPAGPAEGAAAPQ